MLTDSQCYPTSSNSSSGPSSPTSAATPVEFLKSWRMFIEQSEGEAFLKSQESDSSIRKENLSACASPSVSSSSDKPKTEIKNTVLVNSDSMNVKATSDFNKSNSALTGNSTVGGNSVGSNITNACVLHNHCCELKSESADSLSGEKNNLLEGIEVRPQQTAAPNSVLTQTRHRFSVSRADSNEK